MGKATNHPSPRPSQHAQDLIRGLIKAWRFDVREPPPPVIYVTFIMGNYVGLYVGPYIWDYMGLYLGLNGIIREIKRVRLDKLYRPHVATSLE